MSDKEESAPIAASAAPAAEVNVAKAETASAAPAEEPKAAAPAADEKAAKSEQALEGAEKPSDGRSPCFHSPHTLPPLLCLLQTL